MNRRETSYISSARGDPQKHKGGLGTRVSRAGGPVHNQLTVTPSRALSLAAPANTKVSCSEITITGPWVLSRVLKPFAMVPMNCLGLIALDDSVPASFTERSWEILTREIWWTSITLAFCCVHWVLEKGGNIKFQRLFLCKSHFFMTFNEF